MKTSRRAAINGICIIKTKTKKAHKPKRLITNKSSWYKTLGHLFPFESNATTLRHQSIPMETAAFQSIEGAATVLTCASVGGAGHLCVIELQLGLVVVVVR